MSLEITFLDYEKTLHLDNPQDAAQPELDSGCVQYDPQEKTLLFYDSEKKQKKFTINIKKLKTIQESLLNKNILAFDYTPENSNEIFDIKIYVGKKDILGARSFKILTEKILNEINETKKREKKIFTDIIPTTPKEYQKEMLEIAKNKNTIIFLETGMGKTYIGVMLIKYIFGEPLEANAKNYVIYKKKTDKKVLCLFQTVSLLLQQAKVIKHNTNLRVIKLYGNNEKSSLFNHDRFTKTIEKYDIICATPETIYRYFTFGYINREKLALILIDECHHCNGDHFYNKFLSQFIFDEGDQKDIKILGLTASPCEQGVLEENKIREKIVQLCNNMNCYITCPKNIFDLNDENNELKEPNFLTIDNQKENKNISTIIEVKNYLFNFLLLPFLDLHFKNIYDSLTETYKIIPEITPKKKGVPTQNVAMGEDTVPFFMDENEEIKPELTSEQKLMNEKIRKENKYRDEQKKIIAQDITQYILNFYLTLFIEDENKLDEKFMGLYDKNDDINLLKSADENCYLNYFKNNVKKLDEKLKFMNETNIIHFVNKLSEEEENRVNFSVSMRIFIKRIQEDEFLKSLKNFVKLVNLVIKYLDKEALVEICEEYFDAKFLDVFKELHLKEYIDDTNSEEKNFMNKLFKMLEPKKILQANDNFNFKSSYIESLINFLISPEHSNDKSILFINQRAICKAFNRKINLIFKNELKNNYESTYVLGISSSDKFVKFSEKDLKQNIKKFKEDKNCIILCATNVVEEGIDVPSCNNVINLNELKTIKEYIQKTGRARQENNKLFLFSSKCEEIIQKNNLKEIQLSIKVMKKMLKENNFVPQLTKYKFKQNVNCFKTDAGAKVYVDYAPQIVREFISKLYNDGYNYNRADIFIEETDDKLYRPCLLLPSVLETSFQKIYDNENLKFNSKKDAEDYFHKYENYYYFKALINLHLSGYLNKFLQFTKNYDNLMSYDEKFKKCEGENSIEIKNDTNFVEKNECELIGHILKLTPGYIDITYNEKNQRFMVLLAEKPLVLLNFDLFLPNTALLKLYYFGRDDAFNKDENKQLWFDKKPKIPYTKFAKVNCCLDETIKIKILKEQLDLINFFYTYTLFVSTDAEMFFYYGIYKQKFEFCRSLFKEDGISDILKNIFDHYDVNYLDIKQHLKNYQNANLEYHKHMIKYSFVIYDKNTNTYQIDYSFIKKTYKSVINDLKSYNTFSNLCLKDKEEVEKLLINDDYLKEETKPIEEAYENEDGKSIVIPGMMTRNLLNFCKCMIMNFGEIHLKGALPCKKYEKLWSNPTYQKHYLYKYGILTGSSHDYLKCVNLDYNVKLMKYKINLTSLGKVDKRWNTFRYIKKFHFFPSQILQPITFISVDQLYMFTLMPVLLFKLQNSLIYYYNTKCLLDEFKLSLGTLEKIDIKLIMQCLNSKSTLEIENYERLEFLGDSILKFLSSIQLYNVVPNANRDLLFSLRRDIENNQFLFEKSTGKELEKILFTSARTIKRMLIPGFTKDENVIFDISYNRSFTKNCYIHKRELKLIEKENQNNENTNDKKIFTEKEKLEAKENMENDSTLKDERYTDKISIDVNLDKNLEPIEVNNNLLVDQKTIKDIVENKIVIIPSQTYRFIYTKTLADIVESLTAFSYLSSLLNNNNNLDNAFNFSTIFLKEMGVLSLYYNDMMKDITKISLENVSKNENCTYNDEQKNKFLEILLNNGKTGYKFKNNIFAYQAMTHPSCLEENNLKTKRNYVNKSYQRFAFLGEAIVELYVSLFVYENNPYETESNLHKMRICGINHHIISLIAIELKLHDTFLHPSGGGFKTDIEKYKCQLLLKRPKDENKKYKLPVDELDNEEFVIILCELFHSYIGAIFVDSHDIKTVFNVLDKVLKNYLLNNATKDTFTEHPKEIILNEYMKRRHYIKSLKENGGNRIILKFEKERAPYRKRKTYTYQLIIDGYIIYQENIAYNRPAIKVAQEKAKSVFLRVCDEIDRRIRLKMNERNSHFNIKNILDYLGINYEVAY